MLPGAAASRQASRAQVEITHPASATVQPRPGHRGWNRTARAEARHLRGIGPSRNAWALPLVALLDLGAPDTNGWSHLPAGTAGHRGTFPAQQAGLGPENECKGVWSFFVPSRVTSSACRAGAFWIWHGRKSQSKGAAREQALRRASDLAHQSVTYVVSQSVRALCARAARAQH